MKIKKLIVAPGMGGYYYDDLHAVKNGAKADGYFLIGKPVTPGHKKVRNPGETVSVMLELDSGDVAVGSCVAIQYSGVVGRDPIFLADEYIPIIKKYVAPLLEGKEITTWRETCNWFEQQELDGKKFHTAIRYGISQALLDAVSIRDKMTQAEVVAKEYGTTVSRKLIPIAAQSSDNRYNNADKMIIKSVPIIPQGLFNQVEKVGEHGEKMAEYVTWLVNRVKTFGEPGYDPIINLDVYGIPGKIFNNDPAVIADYLVELEKLAKPYRLIVEDPVETGTYEGTMQCMKDLMRELKKRGSAVTLTIDEWCNTLDDIKEWADKKAADRIQIKAPDLGSIHNSVEAVIYCKEHGVEAFLGGTCNGTDISSRSTVNCAMATNADMVYNKPGMGVDEGYMIVYNEMMRILATLEAKNYWDR